MAIDEILGRMIKSVGGKTQTDLGEALGVAQASISDAKRKGKIPPDWFLKLSTGRGLNPNWLLTGEGPMLIPKEDVKQFDVNLLKDVIAVFESCIKKLNNRDLVIDPENKAKWIVFFYEDFVGKSAAEKSKEKVEEKIYAVMKLPHLKG